MDNMTRDAALSDLFFNYRHERYEALVNESDEVDQTDVAKVMREEADAFVEHYFSLLSKIPGFRWDNKESFAAWLHVNYMSRR